MRLDAYMREHKLTQAALGAMLTPPVSQSQVSQWFRGRTSITLEQALQIQSVTNGEVTPADCAGVHLPDDTASSGDVPHKPHPEAAQIPA
ncbi:hypothetical protein BLA13014_04112 [Burkholderia aenigmatica]|uniref:HTH cro/C1-type domain-containing protein n=1 Tax=Burkholderia aenigmatica TaxID=2015348 RepID=A0A6P2MSQ6_9BURK|nr:MULTISPECIES: helix-turn-helix transcriptional regulator [Burkholderia]VWB88808.1 hypothetical protein BLA13014_04112 [Burkholderia aenigmatica]